MKPHWWEEAANDLARRDRVMRKLVRAHPGDLQRACDAIVAAANGAGGIDNITCVLVQAHA